MQPPEPSRETLSRTLATSAVESRGLGVALFSQLRCRSSEQFTSFLWHLGVFTPCVGSLFSSAGLQLDVQVGGVY